MRKSAPGSAVPSAYVGRFAPSPTGPLHLGSLTTALASWVDARANHGSWLLRIEDIDPEREVAGATALIIASLKAHQLLWDNQCTLQSQRSAIYEKALSFLRKNDLLYACICTRKQLRAVQSTAYPGFCRSAGHKELDRALRVKVTAGAETTHRVTFDDLLLGQQSEDVAASVGDFIVRRRGLMYAYQLAVVCDDASHGVTHVVRGADLLDNTARQIVLQNLLAYDNPEYLHVPVIMRGSRKLSKQTGAMAIDDGQALHNLLTAWHYLGQLPPDQSATQSIDSFLAYAISNWQRRRIGKVAVQID